MQKVISVIIFGLLCTNLQIMNPYKKYNKDNNDNKDNNEIFLVQTDSDSGDDRLHVLETKDHFLNYRVYF